MATLSPDQAQAYNQWLMQKQQSVASPPTPQGGGGLGSIFSTITKPFRTLGHQAYSIGNVLTDPSKPIEEIDSPFLSDQERQSYWQDPILGGIQTGAGIGSFATPGAGALGGGLKGAVASGALGGALGGFSEANKDNLLGGTLTGAATGGVLGGAMHGVGKGLKNFNSERLNKFADERDLNALRRNVGSNAPRTGKGGLKGALLEKETQRLSKLYKTDINDARDLLTLGNRIDEEVGGQADALAQSLTQRGVTINTDDVIGPLKAAIAAEKSPTLRKPLEDALAETAAITGGNRALTPVDVLELKRTYGRLMSASTGDNKTLGEAYRRLFGETGDILDNISGGAFKPINEKTHAAIRIKEWGNDALSKERPGASMTHSFQQAGGALGLAGAGSGMLAGGPVGAVTGYLGSRYLQSPTFEKHLAKAARGLGGASDNLGGSIPSAIGGGAQRVIPPVGGMLAAQGSQLPPPPGYSPQGIALGGGQTDPMGMAGGGQLGMSGLGGGGEFGANPQQAQMRQALGLAVLRGEVEPQQASIAMKLFGLEPQDGAGQRRVTDVDKKFSLAQQQAIDALQLLDSGAETGKVSAAKSSIERFFGVQSPLQSDYRSKVGLARTLARNALLGANMSPKELESIAPFIPEFTDEPSIAREKLRNFIMAMEQYKGIAGSGISVNDSTLDMSEEQ